MIVGRAHLSGLMLFRSRVIRLRVCPQQGIRQIASGEKQV